MDVVRGYVSARVYLSLFRIFIFDDLVIVDETYLLKKICLQKKYIFFNYV